MVLIGPDAFFPDYVRKGRVHGVHLSGLRDVRVTSRVKLPESIAVGDLPEDVLVETEYLSYAARFRKDDQGSLVLEARFAEKKTDIGKDEYAAFLADYEKMARALGAGIPLIPAPPKPRSPSPTVAKFIQPRIDRQDYLGYHGHAPTIDPGTVSRVVSALREDKSWQKRIRTSSGN